MLDAVSRAAAAGAVTRPVLLFHFDFLSGPMRVWQGWGDLAADGQVWSGLGELAETGDLETSMGGAAPEFRASLSGVDPTVILRARDPLEVHGRRLFIHLRFFDENWSVLPGGVTVGRLRMDRAPVSRPTVDTVSVGLVAETVFVWRGLAPWGWYSDRDQQRRQPGDLGLVHMPAMMARDVSWQPGR